MHGRDVQRPDLDALRREMTRRQGLVVDFARRWLVGEDGEVYCYAHEARDHLPHPVTHTPDMTRLAVLAGDLYLQQGQEEDLELALAIVDRAIDFYRSPAGSFHQKFAEPWCHEHVFRSAPWANAFFGQSILDAYRMLGEYLDAPRRDRWLLALEALGDWIHRNPTVGTVVFNCALELCSLLWRLGRQLDRPEWIDWARSSLQQRYDRDISPEGLNMGEAGGCSGSYQSFAAKMLAWHVWHVPDDQRSLEVLGQMWSANLAMAAQDGLIPANYGTRGSGIKHIEPAVPLVLAARGDGQGLTWALEHQPSRSVHPIQADHTVLHSQGNGDRIRRSKCALTLVGNRKPEILDVWAEALKTEPSPLREQPAVVHFESIDYRVLRRGPWQMWVTAYEKNVWCRGVNAVHNSRLGNLLAAPLNSLPGRKGIELKRYAVADPGAWAAFPHIRLAVGDRSYHSQRIVESIEVDESDDALRLRLVETLQAEDGATRGRAETIYTFDGEAMRIDVTASGSAGRLACDFHVRKHPLSHLAFWFGDDARALRDGKLPLGGGHWGAQTFAACACPDLLTVQVDNAAVEFQLLELPTNCVVDVDEPVSSGLHAGNFGGTRLRIEADLVEELHFSLRVTCRAPAMGSGG